jgi:hypothetical protein
MKQIDLDAACDSESVGALAERKPRRFTSSVSLDSPFTSAQSRAITAMAGSILKIVRSAGANRKRIKIGSMSFELRKTRSDEVLSIRKLVRRT